MKTLSGVLLLSLTALFTCSDTHAGTSVEAVDSNYCRSASQSHCLEAVIKAQPVSVTDIPAVGCAIPMARLEKAAQAR